MNKRTKRRPNVEHNFSKGRFIKGCILSVALFCVFSIFLLLTMSYFSFRSEMSHQLIDVTGKLSLIISTLLSGTLLSFINREKQIISSFTLSIAISLIVFITSLFFDEKQSLSSLLWYGLIILSCILGGVVGTYITRRKPRKKRHH